MHAAHVTFPPKTDSFGGDRKCKGHRRPVYVAGIRKRSLRYEMEMALPLSCREERGQDYTPQRSRIHSNDEEIWSQGREVIREGNMKWKNQQDASSVHFSFQSVQPPFFTERGLRAFEPLSEGPNRSAL